MWYQILGQSARIGEATALIEAGFEYVTGEYDDGEKNLQKAKDRRR